MTVSIELPNDKKEAAFVLQLLNKLGLNVKKQKTNTSELPDELVQMLEERLIDMEENPDTDISLEAFEKKYYQTSSL